MGKFRQVLELNTPGEILSFAVIMVLMVSLVDQIVVSNLFSYLYSFALTVVILKAVRWDLEKEIDALQEMVESFQREEADEAEQEEKESGEGESKKEEEKKHGINLLKIIILSIIIFLIADWLNLFSLIFK
ncbi:MAG: hypothetical protein ABID38_04535 [Candidatus Diapherotrites archaeon]